MNEFSDQMVQVAVIGAGPYGLSIAAHLRKRGVEHRIFGRPMDNWRDHMPEGMLLKSDGFASNLYDPEHEFTLERFCADQGIPYADMGLPVSIETFTAYGLAFCKRMVPEVEENFVTHLSRLDGGFLLELDNGERITARRVVLAVGITHFAYTPECFAHLPEELASHSFEHHNLDRFKGRRVLVIGGGSSAIDLAGLLADKGADVTLAARRRSLNFHSMRLSNRRPLRQRMRHPDSGLGPGLQTWFYSNLPQLFYRLPEGLRLDLVKNSLGPSGGWFAKKHVEGRVPMLLGRTPQELSARGAHVCARLRSGDGVVSEFSADHIIAATGYKVDVARLPFLTERLRSGIKTTNGSPVLSSRFESSTPGLYFAGIAAASSFGPVMRFAYGAGFAARTISRRLEKVCSTRVVVSSARHVPVAS